VTIAEFDQIDDLSALFSRQAQAMAINGSPLYEELCRATALELSRASRLKEILGPWLRCRVGNMVPLRILGAAHRLVLERKAPVLALFFPTVGGVVPQDGRSRQMCFDAFVATLDEHRDRLPELLAGPPQTNEIARAAALVGVLHMVSATWDVPIRLHELGTSAGLHLRADHMRITGSGYDVGPADSPVQLLDAWIGMDAQIAAPNVVERVGVDRDPIDVATPEGRLHLTSFVWPDQLDRYERLRGAWDLVDAVPVDIWAGDVIDHVRSLRLREGSALVVWHSSVWMYLSDVQRAEFDEIIGELAVHASASSPLIEVSREFRQSRVGSSFPVVIRSWPMLNHIDAPAGASVVLGDSPAQGLPVTWVTPHLHSE